MYLTPASISYLIQFILSLAITGFLIARSRADQPRHTGLLAGFVAAIMLLSFLLFLETSLPRGDDFFAIALETPALAAGLVLLLQFVYRFPHLPQRWKWEANLTLVLCLLYMLSELGYALYRYALMLGSNLVVNRVPFADYPLAIGLLWVPIMFIRQTIRVSRESDRAMQVGWLSHLIHPQGIEARTARALGMVYLLPFGLALINVLRSYYFVSTVLYNVSISIGILVTLAAFVGVYMNYLPGTTSFIVKMAAVTLMALLAVLGAVGWVIAPIYAEQYKLVLPEQQTFRYTPNESGGYTIHLTPFSYESDLGTRMDLDEAGQVGVDIDFAFPFFDQVYGKVYVSSDGMISMGQSVRYFSVNYHYGGQVPIIFPLLMDLDMPIMPGGVYIRQAGDNLLVTWKQMPAWHQPADIYTFQLKLYADGVFDITYADVPDHIHFQPNEEVGRNPWVTGAVSVHQDQPQLFDIARLPFTSDGRGAVQDYMLEFRRHLHELMAPLAYMILASSLLVVVGFPFFFYTNLVRPLNSLQKGVQQLQAQQYDVSVPVQYQDEIGYLTQAFNQMAGEMRSSIKNLEARVQERTQALNEAKENAEAANRAKSTFLANMSHELRTPLNAILGFSEIMRRDPALDPDQQEQVSIIYRSSEHLLALINDILELSKIEAGRVDIRTDAFNLFHMLQGLEEMFVLHARQKNLELHFERDPNVPRNVVTDQGKLRQVLINLLGNAVKFTEAGGVVLYIRASTDAEDPVSAVLTFEVVDTGIGIASENLERVFEHFVQLAGEPLSQEGTGLGLPISRQYVELMGGHISVTSQPNLGSVFSVVLPVSVVALVAEPQPERRVIGLESGQPTFRLLVAEDKETNRILLAGILQELGCEVKTATNGQEAFAIWQDWQPHLIFMDLRMPVMDGLESTRRIKKAMQSDFRTFIIALTASAFDEDRSLIVAAGCDDFIRKPFRQAQIYEILQRYLGIRYVYGDPTTRPLPTQAAQENLSQIISLPSSWRSRLRRASIEGDIAAIEDLTDEIEIDHPRLAGVLKRWAQEFDYGRICSLLDLTDVGK